MSDFMFLLVFYLFIYQAAKPGRAGEQRRPTAPTQGAAHL
jgi:hypothetical protein